MHLHGTRVISLYAFFLTKTFMYFTAVYPYLLMGKYYYYDVSVK